MAYRILLSAPDPFWVYLGWNSVGLGWDWVWGDWGLRGWGLGLDNCWKHLSIHNSWSYGHPVYFTNINLKQIKYKIQSVASTRRGLLTDGVVGGCVAVHVCPHPVHGLRLAHVHDSAAQTCGHARPPIPNLYR